MSELQNNPHLDGISSLPPKNYLVESILVTLFCCMPLGVVAIVQASKVNSAWEAGNKDAAIKASNEAKKWLKWGIIGGVVSIVLYVILMVGIGVMQ